MRPLTFPEAVENLIRGIRGGFDGHEFHEFHESDHCDLDVMGLKYKCRPRAGARVRGESRKVKNTYFETSFKTTVLRSSVAMIRKNFLSSSALLTGTLSS